GSRKYVYGLGLAYAVDTSGNVEVYHTDGLGSVRAMTNAAAQVGRAYDTDEFGVPTRTEGSGEQPFRYTSEQWDGEAGLVEGADRGVSPNSGDAYRIHQHVSGSGVGDGQVAEEAIPVSRSPPPPAPPPHAPDTRRARRPRAAPR
ncbi:MAG: hypothetical protein HYY04_13795, partial [Chloroflexi bacterium]|nr:hypothetical protein [Chloroflexota bacterium]